MEPSFTKIQRNTSIDPDHIYYNVSMANGNLSGGSENDPQIRFFEARDRPIVRNASQYEMSVIKFNINGASKNLPLLIPQLAPAISATASQSTTTVTVTTSGGHGLRTTTTPLTRISLGLPGTGVAVDGVYAITVTAWNTFTFVAPVSQTATWATAVLNAVYSYEKTCYTITIARNNDTSFARPIYWTSETDAPLPASPPNTMDIATNDYFYVYHYGHWTQLVNLTITTILTQLTTSARNVFNASTAGLALASNFGNPIVTEALGTSPRFKVAWNPATKLFSYYANARNWGTQVGNLPIQDADTYSFYYNTNYESLFTGWHNNYTQANTNFEHLLNINNASEGQLNSWVIPPGLPFYPSASTQTATGGTFVTTTATLTGVPLPLALNVGMTVVLSGGVVGTGTITSIVSSTVTVVSPSVFTGSGATVITYPTITYDWVLTQEYNSTSTLWCPVDSIVFTSTNIPVRNEEGTAPIIYGQTNLASHGGSGSFGTIISEITKDMTDASDWREFIFYQPTAQYQVASLDGNDVEIRNIDIFVWWKSRLTGQLVPLRLYNGGSASLKILFRKK